MDITSNLFSIEPNNITLEAGRILIAEPFLEGEYFKRSVILLTEYSEKGAVGYVVNKPSGIYIDDVVEDISDFKSEIFIGGPVEINQVYFIHNRPDLIPNSLLICDDLYWGGDFEVVKILIQEKQITPHEIRFLRGYSGWSAGQLQDEINDQSWVVSIPEIDAIMGKNVSRLWENTLCKMGGKYKMWSNLPKDPNMN